MHRGSNTEKDHVAIHKDKQCGSSSLQAQLWRNDEHSVNQQGSQMSFTKSEQHLYTHTEISKNYINEISQLFENLVDVPSHICLINQKNCRGKILTLECECNTGKSHTLHGINENGAKYACIQIFHIDNRSGR